MTVQFEDDGVRAGAAAALGHEPPFDADECASLTAPLTIRHARRLDELRRFANLRDLTLIACEPASLEPLGELRKLVSLTVGASVLGDLSAVATMASLARVQIAFSSLADPAPLGELPSLESAFLLGCPIDEALLEKLRQQLRTRAAARSAPEAALVASYSGHRKLMEGLRARGIMAGFSTVDESGPYFVRPGLPALENSECDYINSNDHSLAAALGRPDFTVDQMFDKLRPHLHKAYRTLAFRSGRVPASAGVAAEWIRAADLAEDERAALRKLVARFPKLTFYRESDADFQRVGVPLPDWLRRIRSAVAWTFAELPQYYPVAEFDGFDAESVSDRHRYRIRLKGYHDEDYQQIFGGAGILPIGFTEDSISGLAINVRDPSDHKVYEFAGEWALRTNDPWPCLYPVFGSYARMLSRIVRFHLPSGEVVEAV